MKRKSMLVYLCGALFFTLLIQPGTLAQENESKQTEKTNGNAVESLSSELAGNLNLSESQQNRIKAVLTEFQNELAGTGRISQTDKQSEAPAVEQTNKAKQDKTQVKGQNNSEENSDNAADVNTGKAKTKNEANDNMTGRSSHMAVSFERARIDADSRIEEILTPEQAIQYGKIKSDWWDKVREKVQPNSNLQK